MGSNQYEIYWECDHKIAQLLGEESISNPPIDRNENTNRKNV